MALGSSLLILILISLSNSLVLQAYQSWVKANGRENPLPDLSMSVDQLFFIGFATVCFNTPAFFPPSPLPIVVAQGRTIRKVKGVGSPASACKFFWLAMCACLFFFLPVPAVCIFFSYNFSCRFFLFVFSFPTPALFTSLFVLPQSPLSTS